MTPHSPAPGETQAQGAWPHCGADPDPRLPSPHLPCACVGGALHTAVGATKINNTDLEVEKWRWSSFQIGELKVSDSVQPFSLVLLDTDSGKVPRTQFAVVEPGNACSQRRNHTCFLRCKSSHRA